jgi:hypothetical protein
MKAALCFLLLCFIGSGTMPLFSKGIDLIEMKKQEEERRKKLGKAKLAVTDSNVNSISVGNKKFGFVQMTSEDALPLEDAPAVSKNQSETDKTRNPDYWQKQKNDLEAQIAKLKSEIESGQLDLNKLWSDFYIKNIPSEQAAIKVQISQLTNQIEQKKVFLGQFEAQLEELYEKARKAGIPPGWLR